MGREPKNVFKSYDFSEEWKRWGGQTEGRTQLQMNDLVPASVLKEHAESVLTNQESYRMGEDCTHPELGSNGLGTFNCLTCGKYFAQQTNGHIPGLS